MNYKQIYQSIQPPTTICVIAKFYPLNIGHEFLLKTASIIAEGKNAHVAAHIIKTNKIDYTLTQSLLKSAFPTIAFNEYVGVLPKSSILIYSGSRSKYSKCDQMVIGASDPDSDDSQLRCITRGDFTEFRKRLPSSIYESDARRLMNSYRKSLNLHQLKIELEPTALREQYFLGNVFNVGESVVSKDRYGIIKRRGANHVSVDFDGSLESVWISDIQYPK